MHIKAFMFHTGHTVHTEFQDFWRFRFLNFNSAKGRSLKINYMASYFSPTNNQTDAVPMLYLRDPLPSICSESRVLPTNSTMYMNFSSSSGSYSDAMAVNSQRQTNYMDMEPIGASDSNTSHVLLNFGGSRGVEPNFSRNDMLLMNPGASGVLQCGPSQGLSLSLGTQVPSTMQISSLQYQNAHSNFSSNISFEDVGNFHAKQSRDNDYMLSGVSGSNVDVGKDDVPQYGMPGISRAVPNSKYLKAAQELLDEVVNVKKAITEQHANKELMKRNGALDPSAASSVPTETSKNELPDAEKQDLQSKVAKLLSMLEEVERRYRQYYHQMQIVVSSLDTVVGPGSAKPYTTLALQTISRHFRSLRDAINIQIHMVRKSLGEEDSSSLNDKGGVGISRLRFVDQQLRQQRALQQLGMTQHAWRPQRGLPETSVSILRAWLFEHFLHPYPKDSDKIMLARQTGLTRSQVSNWFINARVRLWKPMVEEMYKEEARDEIDSNSSSETVPRPIKTTDTKASEDKGEDNNNRHFITSSSQPFGLNSDQEPNLEVMGSDTNPSFQNLLNADPQSDRFMYHMSELERFGNGGGVSLTLGLQQCEGGTMGITDGTEHGFSLHDFYSSMKD